MFTVYILRTNRNTLYIGQTNNLEKRLGEHRSKTPKASKYMRTFTSFELVYTETFDTRSEAMKREYQLKQLPKLEKETLIDRQTQLNRIRQLALEIVPEAEETISYGMPTLKYHGKAFLGFSIHAHHIGIYPFGGAEIEAFKPELIKLGYRFSKGAIQVPFDQPIPADLLKQIILHRIQRIKDLANGN